jgi:hypothetical protein
MDGERGSSIFEDSHGGYGFEEASMYILELLFPFRTSLSLETWNRHAIQRHISAEQY